jgi:hypothetical protein
MVQENGISMVLVGEVSSDFVFVISVDVNSGPAEPLEIDSFGQAPQSGDQAA